MKIIEYALVEMPYPHILEAEVNKWIKSGWQPLGSVTVKEYQDNGNFIQTMVKYETPDLLEKTK